jgi:hypothetical protein
MGRGLWARRRRPAWGVRACVLALFLASLFFVTSATRLGVPSASAAPTYGGYEMAFQANNGSLYNYGDAECCNSDRVHAVIVCGYKGVG